MNFKLSPSDLGFFYEGCRRCFYLKVVRNVSRPSVAVPAVFSQMAEAIANHYDGKGTSELKLAVPPGVFSHKEANVKSQIVKLQSHESTCFISGRLDAVVSFEDGTYGVIDFKIGYPTSESSRLYARQLNAYAYALEHPEVGGLSLSPVVKLGLLYFDPGTVHESGVEKVCFESNVKWVEIRKDEQRFLGLISDMLNVLEGPEPRHHSSGCKWGKYVWKITGLE